jgi:hypothetical protein
LCLVNHGERVLAPDTVADEVARLTTLGATALRVGEDLTVMADPEGNEFCVE